VFEGLAASNFSGIPMTHDWMTSYALLSNACQLLGDKERAVILRDILRPFEGNVIIYGIGAFIGGMVSRIIGDLSRLLGDFEDAERCYDLALDLSEQLGSTGNVAWVKVDRAELLLRRGRLPDRAAASKLIAEAEPEVERLGLGLLRPRIEAMRSQLGLPVASSPGH
jgi:tetratricopeptide (TPR) repeat protein